MRANLRNRLIRVLETFRRQRGASLILAVAIISLLTMVGTMVLNQVYTDTQLAGSERAAQDALYVADAGAVWGQQELMNVLWPGGSATVTTTPPLLSSLTSKTALGTNDPMCPDGIDCSQWFLLTPGAAPGWVAYGTDSNYRVAATCNPRPCDNSNTPVNYSIRSLGLARGGAQRLVEIVLGT